MTDPRYTDPDSDPVLHERNESGAVWGWVAGIAILILIAFVVAGGWDSSNDSSYKSALHASRSPTVLGTCAATEQGDTILLVCGQAHFSYHKAK